MEKEKNVKTVTRRNFLKTAGATAAFAGLAGSGLTLAPWTAEAAAIPKKWDETYDVVVIGSGFAGLAAAYEAKKAGASVVILEKMRTPGGNSIINGGVVSAAGSPMEEKEGVQDSPELLLKDMLTAGLNLNHVELAKMVAYKSNETVQWTMNELGVKYKDKLSQEGGHSVPRMYSTHNQSGSAIVTQQLAKLKELGVVPKTQSFLTQIFRDADGRVKGIQIREKYVSSWQQAFSVMMLLSEPSRIPVLSPNSQVPISQAQLRKHCVKLSASAAPPYNFPGFSSVHGEARMSRGWDCHLSSHNSVAPCMASGSIRRRAKDLLMSWLTAKSAPMPSSE
jgi:hypothetical protein